MKKIAVQTLPININYGAILQAFALQKYIENLGYDVVLFDTSDTPIEEKRSFFKECRYQLWTIRTKIGKAKRKESKIIKDFRNNFIEKYIRLTPPLYTYKDWSDYIKKNNIEILITGSDQVWRLLYNDKCRRECFLDYNLSPVKKISYAASLGVGHMDQELKSCLLKYLPAFDAISVREEDSVEMLAELDIKSQLCLDPTLLLTKEEYFKAFDLKKIEGSFIFCYFIHYTGDEYDLKQFTLDPTVKLKIQELPIVKSLLRNNFKQYNVIEWLENIYSSKFVLTDSFHGMVFSILFKKPFYVATTYQIGSSRIISLLTQLDLMDRLWDGSKIENHKEIDYDKVYEKLDKLKASSIEFLKENLK